MKDYSNTSAKFPVVGIGVSTASVMAIKAFFENMPEDCGMAFVIVGLHEMTVQDLQKVTSMSVLAVEDDMQMMPNHVFICPGDKDTGVVSSSFYLRDPLPNPRKPLDYFFSALAYDQGENAICIVHSDVGSDGILGLKEIKAQFGMVIVQDGGLVGSVDAASNTLGGLADFVLPIEKMGEQILKQSKWIQQRASQSIDKKLDKNLEILKRVLLILQMHSGHDFSLYKKGTIYRRLESRMRVLNIHDMDKYVRYLERNAAEVETLFEAILINVTHFFRDHEAFDVLENQVIPDLLVDKPEGYNLRIWIPGCSSGEEAYSLAIIIQECITKVRKNITLQIFATDIDEDAILTARTGLYPLSIANDINPERIKRFFKQEENQYRISKEIRQKIIFASHNVITDPPYIKLDMISCRNLLIYFENFLQKRIFEIFHFSLLPNGILFLGPSESFGRNTNLFTVINSKWKIYKRKNTMSKPWITPISGSPIVKGTRKKEDFTDVAETEKTGMLNAIEKMLLENCVPACFVVNEKGDIIYINGCSGRYLEFSIGEASLNISTIVKKEIRYSLRAAIRQTAKTKENIILKDVKVVINNEQINLKISVKPIEDPKIPLELILVAFEEVTSLPNSSMLKNNHDLSSEGDMRIEELEEELQNTKIQLFKTIEEIELSYMETASANEELHSTNEELQSSNEEMETSQEEMQSLYEEVVTVNNELQSNINDLSHSKDDITNLLNSTEIAFIFLDSNLHIMRYTPLAPKIVSMIPSDVGRPLVDLAPRIRNEDIVSAAQRVLKSHEQIEKEVEALDGTWYLMRITPYRTSENMVAGVVMSFVNISKLKSLNLLNNELSEGSDYAWSIIEAIGFPLLVLDGNFIVLTANPDFYRGFQLTSLETKGIPLSDLGKERWDTRLLEEKLANIITEGISFRSFLLDSEFPGIGYKKVYVDVHRINSKKPSADLILIVFKDFIE